MTEAAPLGATAEPRAGDETPARQLAGKYMIFKLGDEEYGLEILKVRELIGLMPITNIPGTRPFIRGVINLRGKVIPVVDLRLKFGMPRIEATDQAVIIVVQYAFRERDLTMGILVDEVVEVLNIKASQIEPPPNFGAGASVTDHERSQQSQIDQVHSQFVLVLLITGRKMPRYENAQADVRDHVAYR